MRGGEACPSLYGHLCSAETCEVFTDLNDPLARAAAALDNLHCSGETCHHISKVARSNKGKLK